MALQPASRVASSAAPRVALWKVVSVTTKPPVDSARTCVPQSRVDGVGVTVLGSQMPVASVADTIETVPLPAKAPPVSGLAVRLVLTESVRRSFGLRLQPQHSAISSSGSN